MFTRVLAVAVGALVLAAGPAHAAYAPHLSVTIDPATPGAAAKVVTNVTQQATETASKTVVVTIPAGFAAPSSIGALPACSADQINARSCPDASRVGSAQAVAAPLLFDVTLSGGVYWAGATKDGRLEIVVFLDNATFNQHITAIGYITPAAGGGFDTTFDNLPNTTTKSFALTFDGGSKAILLTPRTCGDFSFAASFTSQNGEHATASAPVTISGCPPAAPKLTKLAATRTGVRFRLDVPAQVRVLVKSAKTVVDRTVPVAAGSGRVAFRRTLKPGRYRIAVTATAAGVATTRKTTLTVPKPH